MDDDTRREFYAGLDAAILSGRSSADIGRQFSVRSETVRKRRKTLRRRDMHSFTNFEAICSTAPRRIA